MTSKGISRISIETEADADHVSKQFFGSQSVIRFTQPSAVMSLPFI